MAVTGLSGGPKGGVQVVGAGVAKIAQYKSWFGLDCLIPTAGLLPWLMRRVNTYTHLCEHAPGSLSPADQPLYL